MATAVSVLCARMRMEEKWVIEALAEAGMPARQLPPSFAPLPIGPSPSEPFAVMTANGSADRVSGIVVDRCADRAVARATMPLLRASGCTVVDGGLAASGTRLDVARALAAAGLPRPATALITSEDAGTAAASALGWPVTLLPLDPGGPGIVLVDRDIAEATLEHREVLGGSEATISLVQAGAFRSENGISAIVAGGRLIGVSGAVASVAAERIAELAEMTSHVLGAAVLGVEIAVTATGPVVWDARPVPDFRDLSETGRKAVAGAIANVVSERLASAATPSLVGLDGDLFGGAIALEGLHGEVADVVAISA